jgi:hypothetical protein
VCGAHTLVRTHARRDAISPTGGASNETLPTTRTDITNKYCVSYRICMSVSKLHCRDFVNAVKHLALANGWAYQIPYLFSGDYTKQHMNVSRFNPC